MVVGHSTDFAGIDMSLHGASIFLGHYWDWDCRWWCVAHYKARPVNNCLAFSDTIGIYINGTSEQVLTACLAIVLLTGALA